MRKLIMSNWDGILIGLMVIFYAVFLSTLSIIRHNAFASSYDLANVDQTVWNSLFGKFFSLSGTYGPVSRFNFHADMVLALLSPLYLIWNDVRMLLIAQSAAIAMAAVPAWLLAKQILKNKLLAVAIAGLYLINPTISWANLYDFHAVTLAMAGLLWMIYFGLLKNWKWMWIAAILSMMTKEEVSLFVMLWGIFLWIGGQKKQGWKLAAVGIVWFGLFVGLIIPHFSESGTHWAWGWYKLDGGGDKLNRLQKLNEWWQRIAGAEGRDYLRRVLSPWGYLPLIGLPWIILAGPEFAINLLSTHGEMRSTIMHYESVIMPALIVGTIYGVHYIKFLANKIINGSGKYLQFLIVAMLVVSTAKLNYFYSPLPTTPAHWKLTYQVGADEKEFEKVLQQIPPSASITASSEVRNHLTHRINAFNLPNMVMKTDYIAMVDQNRIVGDYNPKEYETELIKQLNAGKDYQLISHLGHFYLYGRKDLVSQQK